MARMGFIPVSVIFILAAIPMTLVGIVMGSESIGNENLSPIYGRVTDIRTGEPLGSVQVALFNNITGWIRTLTAEDGRYQFSAAPRGIAYVIFVFPETHFSEHMEVYLWLEGTLEVNFTLLRPDTNVNLNVLRGFEFRPVQNATVELYDQNGVSIRVLTSDGNGWANTTVPDGRYSIKAFFDPLSSVEEYFEIESPKIEVIYLKLKPPMVSPDAIYSILDEELEIKPGKLVVFSFTASEPSNIYLVMSSSAPVVLMGCGGWVFQMTILRLQDCQDKNELYLIPHSWLTDDTKSRELSFEVPEKEYHLLILNYGSETARLDIELRYDFGDFERGGMDQYSTGQTQKSPVRGGPAIFILFAGVFGLSVLVVLMIAMILFIKRGRKRGSNCRPKTGQSKNA